MRISRNVLPPVTANNDPYCLISNIILHGDSSYGYAIAHQSPNFNHISFGQFAIAMLFATLMGLTFFVEHIMHVISLSTKTKMCRVAAGWVIAIMKYIHAIWDWAIGQYPGDAVGMRMSAKIEELPIPICVSEASIKPTILFAPFVYFLPESLGDGPRGSFRLNIEVMPLDKADWLSPNPAIFYTCLFGNWGGLPATAFAEFYRGIGRGMLTHVDKLLSAFGHAQGRFQRRLGNSICGLNYTTLEVQWQF